MADGASVSNSGNLAYEPHGSSGGTRGGFSGLISKVGAGMHQALDETGKGFSKIGHAITGDHTQLAPPSVFSQAETSKDTEGRSTGSNPWSGRSKAAAQKAEVNPSISPSRNSDDEDCTLVRTQPYQRTSSGAAKPKSPTSGLKSAASKTGSRLKKAAGAAKSRLNKFASTVGQAVASKNKDEREEVEEERPQQVVNARPAPRTVDEIRAAYGRPPLGGQAGARRRQEEDHGGGSDSRFDGSGRRARAELFRGAGDSEVSNTLKLKGREGAYEVDDRPGPSSRVTSAQLRGNDARTAAEETRSKLVQRGERLGRLQDKSHALEEESASFAGMAKQVSAGMQKRRW